jgi:hypothetical protein
MNGTEVTVEEWVEHIIHHDHIWHTERDDMMIQMLYSGPVAYIVYKPEKKYFIIK